MTTLYEKHISENGRVRYIQHGSEHADLVELDDNTIRTMITTFVLGLIIRTGDQLPPHSRQARELKKLETAMVSYAGISSVEMTEDMISAMVDAWNAAMTAIQRRLQ